MKNYILMAGLLLTFNVFADIEYEGESSQPTAAEMATNRACFQDLETQGCGDPGEDPEQFRSCMSNVYPTLTKECKALMTKLYGK